MRRDSCALGQSGALAEGTENKVRKDARNRDELLYDNRFVVFAVDAAEGV
jgi:hypothetical protein